MIELQTALAVEIDESEFEPENLPDISDIVSVCVGLMCTQKTFIGRAVVKTMN